MGEQEDQTNQETNQRQEDQTEYLTEQLPTSTRFNIRLQVFVSSSISVVVFVLAGALFTEVLANAFDATQAFIAQNVGWLYVVAANVFLVHVVWLAISRYGGIRLGPDDSEPDFSYFS